MNKKLIATLAGLGMVVGASADEVEYSTLPQAVQNTIQQSLGGGVVDEVEQETLNGRTVYEVEIERDGDDHEIWVDADGTLVSEPPAQGISGLFQKGDGKILGIPVNRDKDDLEADAAIDTDNDAVDADIDIDGPADRGITEDAFDKNDGKLADVLPAPGTGRGNIESEIEIEDREAEIENDLEENRRLKARADVDVDVDDDDGGIFEKGDGKILGIPVRPDSDNDDPVVVEGGGVGSQNKITTEADGSLDTDDGDGRILGLPKRGFETLPLSKVPEAVRETIRREARGQRIAEIEMATKDGVQVYEVDVEKDGLNRELHIAADGRIVKDSENEAIGSAPGSETGAQSDK